MPCLQSSLILFRNICNKKPFPEPGSGGQVLTVNLEAKQFSTIQLPFIQKTSFSGTVY